MTSPQPFLIAPIGNGLNTYYQPWIIPEDAFQTLEDSYAKRGVVRKIDGSSVLSRVPPYAPSSVTYTLTFSTLTIVSSGSTTLASDQRIWLVQSGNEYGPFNITVTNSTTFTIAGITGSTTGLVNGLVTVYLPIQGLLGYPLVTSGSIQDLVVCTGKQICLYDPDTGDITEMTYNTGQSAPYVATTAAPTALNYELFQGTYYNGYLFMTDFRDYIYSYDGSTSPATVTGYTPTVDGTNYIQSCRAVVAFHNHLICLFTYEGSSAPGTPYPQRARWSWIGDIDDANAFNEVVNLDAGFADAATNEAIVGFAFNRDQLLVAFDRSLWQLRWTTDPFQPFVWERVNNQYGAGATLGCWSSDDAALFIGQYGIVASNGSDVKRIDLPVIQAVQNIESSIQPGASPRLSSNFRRVVAYQDFFNQNIYWAYPEDQSSSTGTSTKLVRNNKLLIWNYLENSWSIANTWYTTLFGYETTQDITWADLTNPWPTYTEPWGSYGLIDEKFLIVAGHDSGKLLQINDLDEQAVDSTGTPNNYGFDIISKFHNPFLKEGQRVRIPYVDLYLSPTAVVTDPDTGTVIPSGIATLNCYVDENLDSPVLTREFLYTGSGTSIVKRVYLGVWGRSIAFELTLSAQQIGNDTIAQNPFSLQGMIVWAQPAGRFVV